MFNFFRFALDKSYDELIAQLDADSDCTDQKSTYYRLAIFMQFADEYMVRQNITSEFNDYRFINNQIKHNREIVSMQQINGGLSLPVGGRPFDVINANGNASGLLNFPVMHYVWIRISELPNGSSSHQYNSYMKNLAGKDVRKSIESLYVHLCENSNQSNEK